MTTLSIRMSGEGEVFSLTIQPSDTVLSTKAAIMRHKQYPIWSQRLICDGKELVNDSAIEDIGLDEHSTIDLLIKAEFFTIVHPPELLDPITGELFRNPVIASDGYIYSEDSIKRLIDSFRGRRLFILFRNRYAAMTFQPHEDTRIRVEKYVKHLTYHEGDNIKSINELGVVFTIIDHIREKLEIVRQDWKVPQLVVVGHEGCGKSTLLERLAMMPLFPRGYRRCTRIKIEVRLRRGPNQNPRLTLYRHDKDGDVAEKRVEVVMEIGAESIEREMDSLLYDKLGMPQICTDKYLVMEITNPRAPNIDLVDIPGLLYHDCPEEYIIRKMISDHFDTHGKHSMYLFVTEATRNINQSPIALIKDRPDIEQNTLGVITHLDKLRPDIDAERLLNMNNLANGEYAAVMGDVPLQPHGFVLTMNATYDDDDDDGGHIAIAHRVNRENDFFRSIGLGELVTNKRAGCDALIDRLTKMYWNHLEKLWLPSIYSKIQCEMDKLNAEVSMRENCGEKRHNSLHELKLLSIAKKNLEDFFSKLD